MRDFADTPVYETTLDIGCEDGRHLAGHIYAPDAPRAVMLVNPATGFRQSYYTAFAKAAACRGWAVLTFDYRGQGESRIGTAKADPATMLEWGRLDIPAAARALCDACPGLPLDLVGHSVGGHFLALLPDDLPIRRVALLSSSSGYWAKHTAPMRYFAWAFWRLIGPASLALHGAVKRGAFWKGEDLPPGVFRDWRDWGVRPDYFRDRLAEEGLLSRYDAFTAPIKAWVADDDAIANRETTRWLLAQYAAAPSEMKEVRRADLGRGKIGHGGLFHPALAEVFWPQVFRFLGSEETAQAAA